MKLITTIILFSLIIVSLIGCTPKIGSKAWCTAMEKKSRADWSANELTAYAKYCVLGLNPDE